MKGQAVHASAARAIAFGPYRLDLAAKQLWRGAEAVTLRRKSWELLLYLAQRPGILISTSELLDAVWPATAVTPNTLTNVIGELRRALTDHNRPPRIIETVHRRGYRFIADVQETDGPDVPTPLSLLGRDADLGRLRSLWQQALQGRRQVVFIIGEPGIGKTTLVDHFVTSAPSAVPTCLVARAQCIEQQGTPEAYMPVLEVIEGLAMAGASDAPPSATSQSEPLVALLRRCAPTWLAQMPSLLPTAEMETLRVSLLGGGAERMLREGVTLLDALTAHQPVLFVIEDLHWCDAATLDLIAALAHRTTSARLMVILTYRPVEAVVRNRRVAALAQQLRQRAHAVQLVPAPFTGDEVRAYLDQRFAGTDVGARLAATIEHHSGGNPLFVGAVVAHLIAQGRLQQRDDGWLLAAGTETCDIGLPEDLHGAIEVQLADIPDEMLRLLEAASVEGEEFTVRSVAAGAGVPPEHVEDALHAIATRYRLVHAAGHKDWPDGAASPRYRFTHVLYHRAVSARLTPSARRRLHQRIGACWEQAYGNRAGEVASQLLVHFEAADDIERRGRYGELSAIAALQRFAHVDAAAHFTGALAQLQRLPETRERLRHGADIELSLGNTMALAYGSADARAQDAYRRAHDLASRAQAPREQFRALLGMGSGHCAAGSALGLEQVAKQQLAMAGSVVPALTGQAYWRSGEAHLAKGELCLARREFEESLQAEGEAGIPIVFDFRAIAGVELSLSLSVLGFVEEAQRVRDDAVARSAQASVPFGHCYALWLAAIVSLVQRDLAAMRGFADCCATLAERFAYAPFRTVRTWARSLGPGRARVGVQKRLLSENRLLSGRWFDTLHFANLAEAALEGGDTTAALEWIAKGLADVEQLGQRWYAAELWRLKGEALSAASQGAQRGSRRPKRISLAAQAAEAEACFRRAIEIARQQQAKLWELRATTSLSGYLHAQGRGEEARRPLAELAAWFSEAQGATDITGARAAHALQLNRNQRDAPKPHSPQKTRSARR